MSWKIDSRREKTNVEDDDLNDQHTFVTELMNLSSKELEQEF
jgi:hypothetical protein